MAAVVRMPALAAGATEAAVQSWLVAVGDSVAAGQEIVEIETEKAVVEYEAEEAGVVAALLVDAGAAVAVGAPIAVLAAPGQSADDAIAEAGVAPSAPAPSAPAPDEPSAATPAPAVPDAPAPTAPAPTAPASTDQAPAAAPERAEGARLFASPLVRRLARERGIDLSHIAGSGPHGRIVRRDLDALPEPTHTPPARMSAPEPDAAYTDIPHTGMRRAIARRLTESVTTVPHFFLSADCRVDEVLALRARINERGTVKISVNDFVLKAVAAAMLDVPEANAIWTEEATRRFSTVDVGVAVSIPGGLVTPVLRGIEGLTLSAISSGVRDLADKARAGRLKQRELEGGSFAVSNLGMYGTSRFSAIINPPHSGILAVGAAERRAVVEGDTLVPATVMSVTLSADHRVLDGALAAQWLAAFTERIENPLSLLV
ncbi:2-oxo acid dehydrogenase subunit E2 [Microbacterium sp. TNHR37B]|uniref:2-oxo acid dehydrogenase subunit E2 n=1 Tax=Microbacterium sp. TNHR37B TaxID=1775956 RepID=UPI0007B24281|nr:2-oxo acid dehydrogenase subunit E2 [Microbacterium sp. TNHR37B]KZE91631.1 Dihydrolipoyllysine-residue acetyltransferase component of pyruvate dehydrogenase complex [Microbacterium sp. TNHR37B]